MEGVGRRSETESTALNFFHSDQTLETFHISVKIGKRNYTNVGGYVADYYRSSCKVALRAIKKSADEFVASRRSSPYLLFLHMLLGSLYITEDWRDSDCWHPAS